MTAALQVNGITLPIAVDSMSHSVDEIGDTARAVNGDLVQDRRAIKRSWEFELTPRPAPEALWLRDWILGRGDVWTFESHLYSSRGVLLPVYGANGLSTGGKFGGKCLDMTAGTYAQLVDPAFAVTGVTVLAWHWTSFVWYLECASWRAGAGTAPDMTRQVTAAGVVTNPSPIASWWYFSGSTLKLTAGVGTYFDDLHVFPRSLYGISSSVIDTDWLVSLAAQTLPKGPAPRVRLTGDLIDASVVTGSTPSILAKGSINAMSVMSTRRDGTLSHIEHKLSGRFEEV
jgi:hypothetical protein